MELWPSLSGKAIAGDEVAPGLEIGGAVDGRQPVPGRDYELQDERNAERKPQAVKQRATGAVAVT